MDWKLKAVLTVNPTSKFQNEYPQTSGDHDNCVYLHICLVVTSSIINFLRGSSCVKGRKTPIMPSNLGLQVHWSDVSRSRSRFIELNLWMLTQNGNFMTPLCPMLTILILMQENTIASLRIQVDANREKEFGGYRSCCGHECSVNTTSSTKNGRWRLLDTWTAPREQNGDMLLDMFLATVGFRMLDGSSSLKPQVRLCE